MNAVIQIKNKSFHSQELSVLTSNLLSLKVCGKKVFSYYFDLLSELGVKKVFIVGESLKEFIDDFYLSDVYPCKILFLEDKEDFYLDNSKLFEEDDLLIIKNIGFIFNAFKTIKEKILKEKMSFILRDGDFEIEYISTSLAKTESQDDSKNIQIKSLSSFKDYIQINEMILNKIQEVDYTCGYINKNGIIKGRNVQIDDSVKVISPVIILDDVKVSKNCVIGPNVVVSNNVFIEDNTYVSNSIICDNTYIGTNLDFIDKVIIRNKVIDIFNYSQYEVDSSLLSFNDKTLI